jgi:hypothetical protein
MAKGKGGGGRLGPARNDNRPNGKAWKKFIKKWDPEKGKMVRVPNTSR